MDYNGFRHKLEDFLANKLEEREAILLREHLNTCCACTMILEDVQATFVPLDRLGHETALEGEVSIEGYRIIERLGKGGMGAVYRAVQLSLERDVALKVLSKELAKNETLIQRFEREAQAAARLSHPNLIGVYDFGKAGETYFISMEVIDGKTVYQLIRERGRLEARRCLEIALRVAEALDYASESAGIIHRDIKPENIMIDSIGEVKIADMGLAKEVGEGKELGGGITMVGERLGTPYYMSPEQIRETKSVDHRADIYSLGATLFHMLTGRRPFAGKTVVETMKLVLENNAEFADEEREYVPAAVRRLVLEMIEKNVKHRIQKWRQVTRKINGLLATGLRGPIKKHR
jgi:serine/threonine protein kinase